MCLLFEDEGEVGVRWPSSLVFLALCSGYFFFFFCAGVPTGMMAVAGIIIWKSWFFSFLCFGSGSAFCSVDFSALDSVFVGCVSAFVPPVLLPLLTVIGSLFGLVFSFFSLFFWVEFSALVPPVFSSLPVASPLLFL